MRTLTLAMLAALPLAAAELPSTPVYGVLDIPFTGPTFGPTGTPTRSVSFYADIRHESGAPTYRLHGYWDGDGAGGSSGNRFVIRFCPTKPGRWNLVDVVSNTAELDNEHEGDYLNATASSNHGFWEVDAESAGGRWFRRSDGSRQFIVGSTYYDFLHKPSGVTATAATITEDVKDIARAGMNKVRFGLEGPSTSNIDPLVKPFFTSTGAVSESQTERVNPTFFSQRVDVAVRTAMGEDVIADLIMGFGTQRVTDDYYLKYIMARYGAFPNVWICQANEWNEVTNEADQVAKGNLMRSWLAYPVPISTHATRGWSSALNGTWHTHTIRQGKLPLHLANLGACADAIGTDYNAGGKKPGINDENGYDPNESSEADVLEGILGSFAGGGYGSTGHKTGSRTGGYFKGFHTQGLTIAVHPSADNLGWMRARIEQHLAFWNLSPRGAPSASIFSNAPSGFRVLAADGAQYVLSSNAAASNLTANLPTGTWEVRRCDVVAKTDTVLSASASGAYVFSTPSSRSCMTIFKRMDTVTPPAAPSALLITPTVTTAALQWTDNATNETGYEVQRQVAGVWSQAANLAAGVTTWTDNGLTPETNYGYRVRALRSGVTSAWIEASTTTLPSTGPLITSPASGTAVRPLQSVVFVGTGSSLTWSAQLSGVGVIASGSGGSFTVAIPIAATNGQTLTVTLTGSGTPATSVHPVSDSTPVVTTQSSELTTAQVGAVYSDDIEAAGGEAPYSWTMLQNGSNPLPPGLAIANGGNLSGTPTAAGTYSFLAQVADADGDVATVPLSVTIMAADLGGRFQESGGLLVMEAENTSGLSANGDSVTWTQATSTPGYAGTGFLTTNDTGIPNATWSTGCEARYDVSIATAGVYTAWVRVSAPNGAGDSVFAGVDGAQIGTGYFSTGSSTSFGWVRLSTTTTLSAGNHAFSLRRREDGYRIDRILLSANAAYVPSGVGPAESPRSGTADTTAPAWIATWPTVNSITSAGFSVGAKIDEAGTAYYVVVAAAAAAPTAAQVKAGVGYGGVVVAASGSIVLSANTEATKVVSGLAANTAYAVYLVAQDGVPNLQAAAVKVTATTSSVVGPTSWKINFQPTTAPAVSGYQVDDGSVYGDRGNGSAYGWITANTANTRDRNAASSADQRYDTLNHMQKTTGQGWSLAVPNGTYDVRVVCGDPSYNDQINTIAIEGVVAPDVDGQDNFDEHTVRVTVTDGRLNIAPAAGATNAKVCFIEVDLVPATNG